MNKKNRYSPLLLFLLLCWFLQSFNYFSFAQTKTEDVVYLKNGSIIRGTILEQKPGEYVKIESRCSNIWVFRSDEIARVIKEEVPVTDKGETTRANGFLNITDMGILAGKGKETRDAPFSLHTINGYRFKNRIFCGAGFGIEFLDVTYVPLFTDLRYSFTHNTISPFLYLQTGYNLPLENESFDYAQVEEKGGLLLNPGAGVRFSINPRTSIQISVSYRYQELKSIVRYFWPEDEITRYEYLHRLGIRFGFYFQ